MTMFSQGIILCFHDTGQCSHQHTPLTDQVAENFIFKSRGKQVTRADPDSCGNATLPRSASGILMDGKTGVNTFSGKEIAAQ